MLVNIIPLAVLTAIHLFAYKLRFLQFIPRSKLLSVSGGVAVAYVFLHILPLLAEFHYSQREEENGKVLFYLALGGLVFFYGMERVIRAQHPEEEVPVGDFWLHLASFTGYNILIGMLSVTEAHVSNNELMLFTIAIGLHFLNTDYALWFDYHQRYPRYGRWMLSAGLWGGWLLGSYYSMLVNYVPYLFAFLVGGVILNVMKEELPKERQSNFWAFLSGVLGYGVILALL